MRQYANSPIIQRLVKNYKIYFDSAYAVDGFFSDIWNVDTALWRGLITWADIVALDAGPNDLAGDDGFLGYETEDPQSYRPFDRAVFYENGWSDWVVSQMSNFTSEENRKTRFRNLILGKAWSNVKPPTAGNINGFFSVLLDGLNVGHATVFDRRNMSITVSYTGIMPAIEKKLLFNYMRPSGVWCEMAEGLTANTWFGFEGGDWTPFDVGPFYPSQFQYVFS